VDPVALPVALFALGCEGGGTALEQAVCTATGPFGLVIIGVYSFLIAFILPLPSEVVLPPAASMNLGVPVAMNYVIVMVVSGAGKAAGSVFAFHIGQEAKQAGPVVRAFKRSPIDIVEWSESKVVELSQKYGYFGLALALSVPGFPDTLSIYAFSVLEEDYVKFAAATFAGSVGRLLVTIAVVGGGIALL
jgi:membrane protein YqaA with SNARE-associated domain